MPELREPPTDPDDVITIGVKPISYGVKLSEQGVTEGDTATLVATGVDWFSATTREVDLGLEWYGAFIKYRQRYPLLIEDWYHQGGYRGQKCVGVSYGDSKRYGTLLRATGSAADEVVAWLAFAGSRDYRVTRLDLRIDILLNELDERVASRIFYANVESKRPRFKLVRSTEGGGETVYVGSPQSASSVRIYDKGAERGNQAGRHWRYEVIYRKPVADSVYDDYRAAAAKKEQKTFIIDNIGSWLLSRGVEPPFGYSLVAVPVITKEKTPWENKLAWLEKSVAKTVSLLIEAGFEEEVRKTLGLE